ncbi:MAG: hypothetical protein RIR51_822 [Bacteroidota bacterium]|jgi:uncharacterized protein (TIGR00255 family)
MIQSMTGFGKAKFETNEFQIKIEIKCLNSKYTDIYCKIPKFLFSKEIEIRNILTKELERGKIELLMTILQNRSTLEIQDYNEELVIESFNKLKDLTKKLGGDIDDSILFTKALESGRVSNEENQIGMDEAIEKVYPEILKNINIAIQEAIEFRNREGMMLVAKLIEYIENISSNLKKVEEIEKERIPAIKNRIKNVLTENLGKDDFDPNRLEQELIYYIEKLDISEEIQRLSTHLNYFLEIVRKGNGKKLNFISQEIGREINTIGSKANDSKMQQLVVQMKDELEKIKEQTANIV